MSVIVKRLCLFSGCNTLLSHFYDNGCQRQDVYNKTVMDQKKEMSTRNAKNAKRFLQFSVSHLIPCGRLDKSRMDEQRCTYAFGYS